MNLFNPKYLLLASVLLFGGLVACSDLSLETPETTMEGWSESNASSTDSDNTSSTDTDNTSSTGASSTVTENGSSSGVSSEASVDVSSSSIQAINTSSSLAASSSLVASSSLAASMSSSGMTNAGSLWNRSIITGQVNVPCVASSMQPFTECEGKWFGYTVGAGSSFAPSNLPTSEALLLYNENDGTLVPGGNITTKGLYVDLVAGPGASDSPTFVGIGFNYDLNSTVTDISAYEGFCVTYTLTGTSPLFLELGWNEAVNKYDVWTAELAPSTTEKTVALKWDLTVTDETLKVSGDFTKKGYEHTVAGILAISKAVLEAQSLKFKLENTAATPFSSTFTLIKLGKLADCQ